MGDLELQETFKKYSQVKKIMQFEFSKHAKFVWISKVFYHIYMLYDVNEVQSKLVVHNRGNIFIKYWTYFDIFKISMIFPMSKNLLEVELNC